MSKGRAEPDQHTSPTKTGRHRAPDLHTALSHKYRRHYSRPSNQLHSLCYCPSHCNRPTGLVWVDHSSVGGTNTQRRCAPRSARRRLPAAWRCWRHPPGQARPPWARQPQRALLALVTDLPSHQSKRPSRGAIVPPPHAAALKILYELREPCSAASVEPVCPVHHARRASS